MLEKMTKQRKLGFFSVLLALTLLSSVICGAYAQSSPTPSASSLPTGQVPPPSISNTPQSVFNSMGIVSGYGIGVQLNVPGWGCNLQAAKSNGLAGSWGGPAGACGCGLAIQYPIDNSTMAFNMGVTSSFDGGPGAFGLDNGNLPYALYVSCNGTTIPINFFNCAYFDASTTNITYVGNLPTFNNTFTFHNISLNTYGQGSSTVTLTFIQQFTFNWTVMTIKWDTDLDLSNMSLYSPVTQQEFPPGASYSFNLVYVVGLQNLTASWANQAGSPNQAAMLEPTDITPTGIYFTATNGLGYQYSLANMNFADSYTENQGNTQIPDQTAQAYFEPMPSNIEGAGGKSVMCYQTFNGLTYGVTTGITSDPTIEISHNPVPSHSSISLRVLALPIIIAIVAVAVILGVTIVFRHRRRQVQKIPLLASPSAS